MDLEGRWSDGEVGRPQHFSDYQRQKRGEGCWYEEASVGGEEEVVEAWQQIAEEYSVTGLEGGDLVFALEMPVPPGWRAYRQTRGLADYMGTTWRPGGAVNG